MPIVKEVRWNRHEWKKPVPEVVWKTYLMYCLARRLGYQKHASVRMAFLDKDILREHMPALLLRARHQIQLDKFLVSMIYDVCGFEEGEKDEKYVELKKLMCMGMRDELAENLERYLNGQYTVEELEEMKKKGECYGCKGIGCEYCNGTGMYAIWHAKQLCDYGGSGYEEVDERHRKSAIRTMWKKRKTLLKKRLGRKHISQEEAERLWEVYYGNKREEKGE